MLKSETLPTHLLTDSLTRVKSRDASASKKGDLGCNRCKSEETFGYSRFNFCKIRSSSNFCWREKSPTASVESARIGVMCIHMEVNGEVNCRDEVQL